MFDMSVNQVLIIGLIILLTASIQSIFGFGFALLSVPLLVQIIELQPAVVLSSMIGTANNIFQYRDLRRDQDIQQVKRFLFASFLGAPFGLMLFIFADPNVLKVVLGIGVLFGVLVLARGKDFSQSHFGLDWAMGVISGVLLTSTSTNGPPLVFALQARRSPPNVFRATLNLIFLVSGLYGIVLFAVFGKITQTDVVLALVVLPMMVVGVIAGRVIRAKVDPERFRVAVLVLLTIAGLSSLIAGVIG